MSQVNSSAAHRLDTVIAALLDPGARAHRRHGGHRGRGRLRGRVRLTGPCASGVIRRRWLVLHRGVRRGAQPARRPGDRPVPAACRRARGAVPDRTQQPTRSPTSMVAQLFDHPAAPDVIVHAHRRPTTGRTTAASGASTGRWASCRPGPRSSSPAPACGHSGSCPGRAGWSTWPPPSSPSWAARRTRRGRPQRSPGPTRCSRRQDGEVLARPHRRPGPRARTTSSGSCSTAATRTSSTTLVDRGEAPERRPAASRWAPSFEHGAMSSMPTVTLANHTGDPHRLPSRPPRCARTTPGSTGPTGEQVITNSPATWPWAMGTLSPDVETHVPGRASAPGPTPSRSSPTSRATPAPTSGPSTSCARGELPERPPRPTSCPSPPSGSCGRRRSTDVVAHRPHRPRDHPRRLGRRLPGRR